MSDKSPDFYAVIRIRSGIILYLIAQIALIAFLIIFFLAIYEVISVGLTDVIHGELNEGVREIIEAVVGNFVALVLVVVAVFLIDLLALLRMRDGFNTLESIGRDVGPGKAGTTLIFVSIVVVIVTSVVVTLSTPLLLKGGSLVSVFDLTGAFLFLSIGMASAEIIFAVGNILLGLGFSQLGKIYSDSATGTGGILYLIGAALLFIPSTGIAGVIILIAGIISVYLGAGHIMKSLTGR